MVSEWSSGLPETVCGKGSKISETKVIRKWLPEVVRSFRIESIADVGCGDQNWIRQTNLHGAVYVGFDIEHTPEKFDVLRDVLPEAFDLVLCIYVLNHLYNPGDLERALRNLRKSGSRYLLATYDDVEGFSLPLIAQTFHKIKGSGGVKRSWHYGLFNLQGSY